MQPKRREASVGGVAPALMMADNNRKDWTQMAHEKARWLVKGAGIDGRTFPVFCAAVSALACELSAEADQCRERGDESMADTFDDRIIPDSMRLGDGLACDQHLLIVGRWVEVRLETYEETECRLMGKGA